MAIFYFFSLSLLTWIILQEVFDMSLHLYLFIYLVFSISMNL